MTQPSQPKPEVGLAKTTVEGQLNLVVALKLRLESAFSVPIETDIYINAGDVTKLLDQLTKAGNTTKMAKEAIKVFASHDAGNRARCWIIDKVKEVFEQAITLPEEKDVKKEKWVESCNTCKDAGRITDSDVADIAGSKGGKEGAPPVVPNRNEGAQGNTGEAQESLYQ